MLCSRPLLYLLRLKALLCSLLCYQKASKEPILEEAELDFRPLEECEEGLEEEEDSQPNETKETEAEAKREVDRKGQSISLFIAHS